MAKKILVVDDNLEVIKLVGLMLETRGYEIIAAQSGAQALAKAQSESPDLMILDIMMPDLDGYEVCKRLRADPATANLPILMFTAKSGTTDKVAGFQAGADDFLTKPIHPDELVSRVETALMRSARRVTETVPVRAKIFGLLGSKGGVGTTTLALNVGVVLAQELARGKQVIVADLRSGLATLGPQLDMRGGGLVRLLNQPVQSIQLEMVEAQLEEHRTGIRILSGQIEPPGVAAAISPTHAQVILRDLGASADYVLLDLGVGLDETNRYLLPACHHIIVTVEPQRVTLAMAQALLSALNHSLSLPSHKIGVVIINKAPSGATFTKDTIQEMLKHELIAIITPAPELAYQASERGVPMVVMQPESLVARQFRNVAEFLMNA
jgi:DNA-binding response OmpR family regulator/CO dehydrogenase nickel-insertion accessory protein CooC1